VAARAEPREVNGLAPDDGEGGAAGPRRAGHTRLTSYDAEQRTIGPRSRNTPIAMRLGGPRRGSSPRAAARGTAAVGLRTRGEKAGRRRGRAVTPRYAGIRRGST